MILYLNIVKMFHLKQIMKGNEKWILYNNVEWKRLWGISTTNHAKGCSSSKESDIVHIVDWKGAPFGKPND